MKSVCGCLLLMGIAWSNTCLAGEVSPLTFVAGTPEVVYTAQQRVALGLNYWPDGNLGVVTSGSTYGFYAANSGQGIYTTGTLDNPGGSIRNVTITNRLSSYNYMAGGQVYDDPVSGRRLLFYHAEFNNPTSYQFYGEIGIAISTDANKLQFRDLGPILRPNATKAQAAGFPVDVGGGTFAVNNGKFYVYFHDYEPDATQSNTAVAAAPISTVIANALANQSTPFEKYYNGSFSQPGLGGLSSPLEPGNPNTRWSSVSYNSYLNQYVMAVAESKDLEDNVHQVSLYLTSSSDGLNWGPRQFLAGGSGELFYPNLVGIDGSPNTTGKTFDVYFTSSQRGGFDRWTDASLMRISVTVPEPGGFALMLLAALPLAIFFVRTRAGSSA